jgi:haloalkane dehalogenase
MDIIRTPDERFANLTGYPFTPHYLDVGGLRIHYADEGPRETDPVLLLHGEPTWSYMFRDTITALAAAGHRVIAPDLPGFGRSDKPLDRGDYTYQRHVAWMRELVTALGLREITLVGHDWGGFIGLRLAAENPHLFARIAAAETDLRTGDEPVPDGMRQWQRLSQEIPVFLAGEITQIGTVAAVPDDVRAGYDAPFPDSRYQQGARQFPLLIPTSPDDPAAAANRAAWQVLRGWDKPFLAIFTDDPVFRDANARFQESVPGAKGQPHRLFPDTGHFLTEDLGPELAEVLVGFLSPP